MQPDGSFVMNLEEAVARVQAALDARDVELADSLCRAILAPLSSVHHALGFIAKTRRDVASGLSFLAVATSLEPRNVEYALSYGGALYDVGRVAEASAIAEHCTSLDPDSARVQTFVGSVRLRLDQNHGALSAFE